MTAEGKKSVPTGSYYLELKAATDIASVARELMGERITSDRTGNIRVQCPHHRSASGTSFSIDTSTGLWTCFGCSVGGDIIHLVEFVLYGVVSKFERGDRPPDTHVQARDWLAHRCGSPLLQDLGLSAEEIERARVSREHRETVLRCLDGASLIFHRQLLASPEKIAWVEAQWGLTRAAIERFRIGWAPEGLGLVARLEKAGFDESTILGTGLVQRDREQGHLYETFRDRIVIPYLRGGKAVYAIGRCVDAQKQTAKYLKLPVHDPYDRPEVCDVIDNGTLFGEDALSKPADLLIITEGITDAIALQMAGFAAVSPGTVRIKAEDFGRVLPRLKKFERVMVVFDNELSATGSMRALELARALRLEGVEARIATLPLTEDARQARDELEKLAGEDAMSRVLRGREKERGAALDVIQTEHGDAAKELIAKAKVDVCELFRCGGSMADFRHALNEARTDIEVRIDRLPKAEAARDCGRELDVILSDIADLGPVEQEHYVSFVSKHTRLNKDAIRRELRELKVEDGEGDLEKPRRSSPGNHYEERSDGLFWLNERQEDAAWVRLTNFRARIVEETILDDGQSSSREYQLEGRVPGHPVQVLHVPAGKFASLEWIAQLGPMAILEAGYGLKDHTRAAIQQVSGSPDRKVCYTHTGWQEVDGAWVYLHSGGSIGSRGSRQEVGVRLCDELARVSLDHVPMGDELRSCLRALVDLADSGADTVTLPLIAGAFRSVLGGCQFSIHLEGASGTFKTHLAGVIQSFFGADYSASCLPGSWSSTANALEELCFYAKDCLVVIDDCAPQPSRRAQLDLEEKVERLFRSQGNSSGRARLNRECELQSPRHPRGLILSSGEFAPKRHSIRARILLVHVKPGSIEAQGLSRCQAHAKAGMYAGLMAAFLRYLAPRREEVLVAFRSAALEARDSLTTGREHRRSPDKAAELLAAFDVFLGFASEVEASDPEVIRQLGSRLRIALTGLLDTERDETRETDEVEVFLRGIRSAVRSGRAHFTRLDGDMPSEHDLWGWRRRSTSDAVEPRGDRIGLLGEGPREREVYLDIDAALKVVQEILSAPLMLDGKSMAARLNERGCLARTEGNRNKVRLSIGSSRPWMIALHRHLLLESDPGDPSDPVHDPVGPVPEAEFGGRGEGGSVRNACIDGPE